MTVYADNLVFVGTRYRPDHYLESGSGFADDFAYFAGSIFVVNAAISAVETADIAVVTADANPGITEAVINANDSNDSIVIMAFGDVVTGAINATDSADLAAISTAMPTGSAPPTTRILRPRRRRLGSDAYGVPPAG